MMSIFRDILPMFNIIYPTMGSIQFILLLAITLTFALGATIFCLTILWKSKVYSKKEKRIYTFFIVFLSFAGCLVFYLMHTERKKIANKLNDL